MHLATRVLIVVGCLLLIPVTAVLTAAAKQRLSDGSDFVFSGGPLVSGELHTGPEPDWSFTNDIVTIELQLEDPPRSRTIWVGEHDGKLYVFSAYMRGAVGRLWKNWPRQAERDGRAVLAHRRQALRAPAPTHRVGSDPRRHHRLDCRQVHVQHQPGTRASGRHLAVRGGAARSIPPTPMNAGGRPSTLKTLAGTARLGTYAPSGSSPRNAPQPCSVGCRPARGVPCASNVHAAGHALRELTP